MMTCCRWNPICSVGNRDLFSNSRVASQRPRKSSQGRAASHAGRLMHHKTLSVPFRTPTIKLLRNNNPKELDCRLLVEQYYNEQKGVQSYRARSDKEMKWFYSAKSIANGRVGGILRHKSVCSE